MIKLFLHNEFNIISTKWSFILRIQYGCWNLKHYIYIPGNQVEGEKGRGKTSLLTSKGRSLEAVICFQKAAKKVGQNCFILESPMVNMDDGKNAYLETTISFTHSHWKSLEEHVKPFLLVWSS